MRRFEGAEIDDGAGDVDLGAAYELAGGDADEIFGVANDLLHAGEGAIPLQHDELAVVATALLAATEAAGELETARDAAREEALHLVFRAGDEVAGAGGLEGVEVDVEAGGGDERGSVDLDEMAGVEGLADGAEQGRSGGEGAADSAVHEAGSLCLGGS
ncbi:MAG: hypothetical protein R3F14_10050 [Polyangiaceae bacterium]